MYIVFITILFMPATLGQETKAESDTLVVLWTSSDIEVAEKIVYCRRMKTCRKDYKKCRK